MKNAKDIFIIITGEFLKFLYALSNDKYLNKREIYSSILYIIGILISFNDILSVLKIAIFL